jgi:broad specificity phosphatase PhoE
MTRTLILIRHAKSDWDDPGWTIMTARSTRAVLAVVAHRGSG